MKILIIGGSRGIGLEAAKRALACGHAVRAMARNADRMELSHNSLERFSGDARDAADIAKALQGVDAVIQALGIAAGPGAAFGRVDLFSRSTAELVAQMERNGPRRLLAITGFGSGDSRSKISFLERIPFQFLLRSAYDDKDRQERIIRESGLDWTIVRPTLLTNGPRTGSYRVLLEPESWRNGLISRADVADFLIRRAEDRGYIGQTPVLAY